MIGLSGLEGFGIITTFVLAVVGLGVGVHNQREQSKRDTTVAEMQAAQLELDRRLAEITLQRAEAEAQAAQRAVLRFQLISEGGGSFRLALRNEGRHEATAVVVYGKHDTGSFRDLDGFHAVAAGETKSFGFTNAEWQVLQGQRFDLRFNWTDGEGRHEGSTTATI